MVVLTWKHILMAEISSNSAAVQQEIMTEVASQKLISIQGGKKNL